jgi:MYXO-CTERM domain-containing protein
MMRLRRERTEGGGCGCRIEAPPGTNGGFAALFALAGVAVVAARRRRRG